MRRDLATLSAIAAVIGVALSLVLGGCGPTDCLPEPEMDATPPEVNVTVTVTSSNGTTRTIEHAAGDAPLSVDISSGSSVSVTYSAVDSSGLRSLSPGMTIHETVGVGVERRSVRIEPVRSECPVASLSLRREVRGVRPGESVVVTMVAENWVGDIGTLESATLRYR
ncbi:MAG: hypothetical protein WD021_05795 [Rhodothermales bacterium]